MVASVTGRLREAVVEEPLPCSELEIGHTTVQRICGVDFDVELAGDSLVESRATESVPVREALSFLDFLSPTCA